MSANARALGLFGLLVLAGCPEDSGFFAISASLRAVPLSIDLDPVWAGHGAQARVVVHNDGAAPVTGVRFSFADVDGPAQVAAHAEGDAIAPGGRLAVDVVVDAAESGIGLTRGTLVIDSDDDGGLTLPLRIVMLPAPSCDDANPCTADRFDAEHGACAHELLPDLSSCDDGSACTSSDVCVAGRCLGAPVSCDDGVECTVDACDTAQGCVYQPVHERCADEDPCTDDVCGASGCENPDKPAGALCYFGGCEEIGLCMQGQCVMHEVPDGAPCEDGDPCTISDFCFDGVCAPGAPAATGSTSALPVDGAGHYVDLCRGPEDRGSGMCWSTTTVQGIEAVLATRVLGEEALVLWRTAYLSESYGSCDPTDPLFVPTTTVPPAEPEAPDEPEGGMARPMSFVCAAGVFLSRVPLAGDDAVTSLQLTAARGPVAAAFVDGDVAAVDESLPAVVTAQGSYGGGHVLVDSFALDGVRLAEAVVVDASAILSAADRVSFVAVDADDSRAVLAAHGELRAPSLEPCVGGPCSGTRLLSATVPHLATAPSVVRTIVLDEPPESCAALAGESWPLSLSDVDVRLAGGEASLSLAADLGACLDSYPASSLTRAWLVSYPADDVGELGPLPAIAGYGETFGGPGVRALQGAEGGAAVIVVELSPSSCESASCDSDGLTNALPALLYEVRLRAPDGSERALDTASDLDPGPWAPLVVQGEAQAVGIQPGTGTLLRRWLDHDGLPVEQAAPAPAPSTAWAKGQRLVASGALVAGLSATSLACDDEVACAPDAPPDGKALVQLFGCGLEAHDAGPAQPEDAGAADEDAGAVDEDAGAVDEDAGAVDDDDGGTVADGG